MPSYGKAQTGGVLSAIYPGQSAKLFDAETLTPPQASVAINRAPGPLGEPSGIVFSIDFAENPTTAELVIQGANVDVEAAYQTLFTSTNTQHDKYADYGMFAFYRAKLNSQAAGGAVTVIAQR